VSGVRRNLSFGFRDRPQRPQSGVHFVNVVDDMEMQITHVIRVRISLSNTPKQIASFALFGVEPPQYAHVGDPESRRHQDEQSDPDAAKARLASLQTYVEDGYVPRRSELPLPARCHPKTISRSCPSRKSSNSLMPQILRNNAPSIPPKLLWMNGE